jgi:hypothetical protein
MEIVASFAHGEPRKPILMPQQAARVIILTSGLSGSSVLTGLISRAGYWLGESTFKKEYDTYENSELITLNSQLFERAGYTGNYTLEFSQDALSRIASLRGKIHDDPFRKFLEKCDQHAPWLWKDPRLWLTIRFWKDLLPRNQCKFIVLTRDLVHCWVSSTLRRHVRSYSSLKRYEESIRDSLLGFLTDANLSYLHITYEDLIARPGPTISELNRHLGTELGILDLQAIYRGPLHKIPRNKAMDYIKAGLIYIKNYSEREDRFEKRI